MVKTRSVLLWMLILSLSLLQSSYTNINWLWLVVIWLGLKERWVEILIVGIILDLVSGTRIGLSSLQFLPGAMVIFLAKEYWPLRSKKQLKLNLD